MDRRNPAPPVNSPSSGRNKSDPLRSRGYIHFDERPARQDLLRMISDAKLVAKWQFMPLIEATTRTKKIKSKKNGIFSVKIKERPICYASHKDAALYAFYSKFIERKYSDLLVKEGMSECVTAFRAGSGKCSIHFAKDAFDWIRSRSPCVALAYDVKSFFDSLDHGVLKEKWKEVLGGDSLPADHFSIYRSLVKSCRVDRDEVYRVFDINKNNPKAGGRKRICSASDFREKVSGAGMIKKVASGIPQGTPISAVLSNIYMIDFDRKISKITNEVRGFYRRYCDDILCVVPIEEREKFKIAIEDEIKKVKLEVQHEKLVECDFRPGWVAPKPLQYLGLTFDGDRIRLRSSSIAKYYSRMRGGVRTADIARRAAARKKGLMPNSVKIKRVKINRKYSYVGSRNFISYAHRASYVTSEDGIKTQVARHWAKLGTYIAEQDDQDV